MTDRLQEALDRLDLTARRLGRRARADLEAAYAPSGQSYEAAVSGSGGTSTTELAGLDAIADLQIHARDAKVITRELEKAANLLARCEEKLLPPKVGGQCPTVSRDESGETVSCTGEAQTHRGLCVDCDADWRSRRPDVDIPAHIIADRNARRTVKCQCHAEHDHAPGVCVRDLQPGQTVGRCRQCREAENPRCDDCGEKPPAASRTICEGCKTRRRRKPFA